MPGNTSCQYAIIYREPGFFIEVFMEEKILDFINRRWSKDADWTNGNCYYFAVILKTRFPSAQIKYCPIKGHFIIECDNKFYDWNGRYYPEETPMSLFEISSLDPLWYSRIARDCIY